MLENIFLAGVFDRFHEGHRHAIKTAIENARNVYLMIGQSGDADTHPDRPVDLIQPIESRVNAINAFLKEEDPENKVKFTIFKDKKGMEAMFAWIPLWEVKDITFLQVVDDRPVLDRLVLALNKLRVGKNLPEIKFWWLESLKGKDGRKISATDLRKNDK